MEKAGFVRWWWRGLLGAFESGKLSKSELNRYYLNGKVDGDFEEDLGQWIDLDE